MYASWQSFSNVLERKIKQSTHGKECCTICEQQTRYFLFNFPLCKTAHHSFVCSHEFIDFVCERFPSKSLSRDLYKMKPRQISENYLWKSFWSFFCQAHLPFVKTFCVAQLDFLSTAEWLWYELYPSICPSLQWVFSWNQSLEAHVFHSLNFTSDKKEVWDILLI